MSTARAMTAVVLAAGKSSRMGTKKALLPLGSVTALERLLRSITRAGIDDTVVVTGYDPEPIIALLQQNPARVVHNAAHESGMFSSVLTGVAAVPADAEALFIIPGDYPLISAQVLERMIGRFRSTERSILHPTCCGLRGHPPLIPGHLRGTLLSMATDATLRDFFQQHREDEVEVEVDDLTILMDMDTRDDYQRLSRLAALLDAMAGPSPSAALSVEDALHILTVLKAPQPVVRHCRVVADVAKALVAALKPHEPGLDAELVHTAALLHDMARTTPKHAVVAQKVLSNLGLTRLGEVVGAHMVLPPEQLESASLTEEQVVYLADKLVIDDRIVGVTQREKRALSRPGLDAAAASGAENRMQAAYAIQRRIETILGHALDEVLSRAELSSI